jgi:hypothetical protein
MVRKSRLKYLIMRKPVEGYGANTIEWSAKKADVIDTTLVGELRALLYGGARGSKQNQRPTQRSLGIFTTGSIAGPSFRCARCKSPVDVRKIRSLSRKPSLPLVTLSF